MPALLMAVLALVSQLALGGMVLPDDAEPTAASELAALSVLCGASVPASTDHQAPHRRHMADGATCPLSVALALPSVALSPAPMLPAPAFALVQWRGFTASPRGPPARAFNPGFPRGPPVLA